MFDDEMYNKILESKRELCSLIGNNAEGHKIYMSVSMYSEYIEWAIGKDDFNHESIHGMEIVVV